VDPTPVAAASSNVSVLLGNLREVEKLKPIEASTALVGERLTLPSTDGELSLVSHRVSRAIVANVSVVNRVIGCPPPQTT
jgi:hypothetical protein